MIDVTKSQQLLRNQTFSKKKRGHGVGEWAMSLEMLIVLFDGLSIVQLLSYNVKKRIIYC